jgi:hypothetical protein
MRDSIEVFNFIRHNSEGSQRGSLTAILLHRIARFLLNFEPFPLEGKPLRDPIEVFAFLEDECRHIETLLRLSRQEDSKVHEQVRWTMLTLRNIGLYTLGIDPPFEDDRDPFTDVGRFEMEMEGAISAREPDGLTKNPALREAVVAALREYREQLKDYNPPFMLLYDMFNDLYYAFEEQPDASNAEIIARLRVKFPGALQTDLEFLTAKVRSGLAS